MTPRTRTARLTRYAMFLTAVAAVTCVAWSPRTASAQEPPAVAQHTEEVAQAPAEDEDTTRWALSAGANISTGNTRNQVFNAGTAFYALRGRHAFTFDWAFNYGRTDVDPADGTVGYENTVRNSVARFRYDFYLTEMDALFLALGHRWDTFAGIQTRFQVQAGYLRNIIKTEGTRAWLEAGLDYTFDNRFGGIICEDRVQCAAEMRPVVFNFQNIVALRLFYGANHAFNENVSVSTGLEFLANLNSLEGGEADAFEDIRVNWDAAVNATLVDRLNLEVKFRLQYDRVPSARQTVDTNTIISLIYTLI